MNPDTTRARARSLPGEIERVTLTDQFTAGAALAALERTRMYEAEAEVNWLLQEHGLAPASVASLVVMLRQAMGAALVRAGHRLAPAPPRDPAPGTALANGTLHPAG